MSLFSDSHLFDELPEAEFARDAAEILPVIIMALKNMEREAAVRICDYAERVVPSYSDSVFRSHSRISRNSAEILVRLLARCPEVPTEHLRGRVPVTVEKQLLVTLWVLGNPEAIRSISDRFNITKSSVFKADLSCYRT